MSLGQLGMLGALCGLLMVAGVILAVRSFNPAAEIGARAAAAAVAVAAGL